MSKPNTIKVTLRGGEYEVSKIDSTHFGMRPAGEFFEDTPFAPYHIGQCHDEIQKEVETFLETMNTLYYEKAFYGYNQFGRAYIPYWGNLTAEKETKIRRKLIEKNFTPGWKVTNVTITPSREGSVLSSYMEDGASGSAIVTVFSLD